MPDIRHKCLKCGERIRPHDGRWQTAIRPGHDAAWCRRGGRHLPRKLAK